MSLKDPEQLYTMGETMGRVHVVSNDFTPRPHPKPIDLTYLLDRPLEHRPHLDG